MLQLAQNPLERAAAFFFQGIGMDIPAELVLPRQREFAFHCHLIPLYSLAVIKFVIGREGGAKYWLHEYGAYVLAWERMALEFVLRNKLKSSNTNLLAKMLASQEGPAYWQKRFDQWRTAAGQSYKHFMGKKFPDVKNLEGEERSAALLGALNKLSVELPTALFSGSYERVRSSRSLWKTYIRNAKRTRMGRWGEPELDTWLIEIWPLVTGYAWNYYELWLVAHSKWKSTSDDDALATVERLEDRCKKMLKLRLGPAGQAKCGTPPVSFKNRKVILPPLASLAIGLQSLGYAEEEWVLGQVFQRD
jgi:hypothetical protein